MIRFSALTGWHAWSWTEWANGERVLHLFRDPSPPYKRNTRRYSR